MLRGARVLDLYAGSGALGLEAASRGAAAVVLVEQAARPPRSIRRNVASLADVLRGVSVRAEPVERVAGRAAAAADRFDLVLLDPPYDVAEDALAAVLARAGRGHVARARGAGRRRALGALARAAVAGRALARRGAPLRRDGDVVRRRRRAGRGGLTRPAVTARWPAGPSVRRAAGDAVRHDRPLHPAPDHRRRRRPHPRRPPPLRGPAAPAARRHGRPRGRPQRPGRRPDRPRRGRGGRGLPRARAQGRHRAPTRPSTASTSTPRATRRCWPCWSAGRRTRRSSTTPSRSWRPRSTTTSARRSRPSSTRPAPTSTSDPRQRLGLAFATRAQPAPGRRCRRDRQRPAHRRARPSGRASWRTTRRSEHSLRPSGALLGSRA